MTPSVDWDEVAVVLTAAAREAFARFLAGPDAKQVYAVGLFFDPLYGEVLPVANTIDYHLQCYRSLVKESGPTDELPVLWDSGNWKYPAGLPPAGAEGFGGEWERIGSAIQDAGAAAAGDQCGNIEVCFRLACVDVLRRLAAEGVFAPATELLGYVVQSPHDAEEDIVANQERVTAAVNSDRERI